jgi:hypothetical protein
MVVWLIFLPVFPLPRLLLRESRVECLLLLDESTLLRALLLVRREEWLKLQPG